MRESIEEWADRYVEVSIEGGCNILIPVVMVLMSPFFLIGGLRRLAARCRKCIRERRLKRWAARRGYDGGNGN